MISPHTDMCAIFHMSGIPNVEDILTVSDIIAFVRVFRVIAKIPRGIKWSSENIFFESDFLDESDHSLFKIFSKNRIRLDFLKRSLILFLCTWSIENLIFLIMKSYTTEDILASLAGENISRIATLRDIPSKMYTITLPYMLWVWTILRFYDIVCIENIKWVKDKPTIETSLIIGTTGCEIAVLRRTISIYIFAVYELFVLIV